jgi:hypothetical protein
MVDPPEERVINERMLLEQLREAPQKISWYISETTKIYVARILGLVKSYWPKANLNPLVDGMSADCSKEKFSEYIEEVKPVAEIDWKLRARVNMMCNHWTTCPSM